MRAYFLHGSLLRIGLEFKSVAQYIKIPLIKVAIYCVSLDNPCTTWLLPLTIVLLNLSIQDAPVQMYIEPGPLNIFEYFRWVWSVRIHI